MRRYSLIFSMLAFTGFASAAVNQYINYAVFPVDAAMINYASNLNQGDAFVNITNSGEYGAFLGLNGSNGDICANLYVFDPAQEMLACCSCLVTPDGLNSFSVKNDLINKTLTPAVPTSVVIVITATAPTLPESGFGIFVGATTCVNSAATQLGNGNYLVGGLRAWGTTLHQNSTGGYSVTENAFQPVPIGPDEASSLPQFCGFVIAEGSQQFGFCNQACNNNGLAGAKK